MKNFAKLLVMALAVTLIASMFAIGVSAAAKTDPAADPNTLKPGSDRVIFIKDAERDPVTGAMTGKVEGDGSGTSPENPLQPKDHPQFDPVAKNPAYYYQTALYQATEELKSTGGTIVLVGPCLFGFNESYGGATSSNRDVKTAEFGNNVIKFTSVYNGVDYRETADAKLIVDASAHMGIHGSSIWDDITVVTGAKDRMFWFDNYATYIGEGFKVVPEDENQIGVPEYYLSLSMGHRYQQSSGENPVLVVKGGSFNNIWGAKWGDVSNYPVKNCNVRIFIEGANTTVHGIVSGSCTATNGKLEFNGNVSITINGGTYNGDIFGVGPTGMSKADGTVKITINDGVFKDLFSIGEAQPDHTNNPPASSVLDLSGFKGEKIQMAYLLDVMETFKEVKLPAGVTEQELADLLAAVPPETDAPATDAPETDPVDTTPSTTPKPTPSTKPSTTPAPEDNGEEGGEFPIAIVIIAAVAVVAIVAVVVVIVLKKKKAAK